MTDCGPHRARNEDAFLTDGRLGLFIVCDGVGGRPSGEIAAAEAIASIHDHVSDAMASRAREHDGGHALDEFAAIVRLAMQRASGAIFALGTENARYAGMSTTAAVVLIVGQHAVVGQVGDTRVYHARGRSTRQLTEDHTLEALRARHDPPGTIRPKVHKSPITRALGLRAAVEVDIRTTHFMPGDRILLCTDGLHEHLAPESVLLHLFKLDLEDAALAAIHHVRQRGGRDNATAIFVEALGHA